MPARAIASLALLAFLGAFARAESPGSTLRAEARVHYERGLKLYEHGRYDQAIDELRAGLALDPQPELLYALGQAERKSGHCERALEHYQACMALLKNATAVAAVRVQIERCRLEQKEAPPVAPRAPAEAPPPPSTVVSPPREAPPPREAERAVLPETPASSPHWLRDPLAGVLAGLGVAGLAAGGALVGVARVEADRATDSYQQFADARNATALWTGGVVTLSVGGALLAAGVVRWAVLAGRHRRAAPRVDTASSELP
jgi:tetratricopeptide (TPR) repeat protein